MIKYLALGFAVLTLAGCSSKTQNNSTSRKDFIAERDTALKDYNARRDAIQPGLSKQDPIRMHDEARAQQSQTWHGRHGISGAGISAEDIATLPTTSSPDHPWQSNHFKITPLKPFQLDARVLHTMRYSNDDMAQITPEDVALGWDRMADPAVLSHFTVTQSGRWYNYTSRGSPIPDEESVRCSKNVHVVPANGAVRDTLFNLRVGEMVKITGYLIRVDKQGWNLISNEDLTRSGAHSCLVFWADSIDVHE
jgi:hypothetical protein